MEARFLADLRASLAMLGLVLMMAQVILVFFYVVDYGCAMRR